MVLINNEFLDNVLDRGLKARYSENSSIFLTDLKNLLLAKNRLQLGKFEGDKCIEDDETSKINGLFDEVEFDIEKDWNILVNARITARNIIDKLIPDEKLTTDDIKTIFWLGPNQDDDHQENIIIELNNGKQYSFFLNKNLSSQKTASFNTFADDLIGQDLDFDNLSRGERNRLILSMSFAFRDVWEGLYQSINLLFVDELMDAGMDAAGVESGLAVLKKMARERNKNIYLISHKDELVGRVNNVLRVIKENGFTSYSNDVDYVA